METRIKRICPALVLAGLAVCLIIAIGSITTQRANAEALDTGELYVAGVDIVDMDNHTVEGDAGTATLTYDAGNNPVLILRNFQYSGLGSEEPVGVEEVFYYHGAILYLGNQPLTIRLEGENKINNECTEDSEYFTCLNGGLVAYGPIDPERVTVTITGNGSLETKCESKEGKPAIASGIYTAGNVAINIEGGKVYAKAGEATKPNGSIGICMKGTKADLNISSNIKRVEASGFTKATNFDVTHEAPGKGWNDHQGTGSGTDLSPAEKAKYDYKKLQFTHKHHFPLNEHPMKPATCTAAGAEQYWQCDYCMFMYSDPDGKSEIKEPVVIPATGHKWDDGKVTKKATGEATGIRTYTCTVCKATKTETIPKLKKKANTLKIKGKKAKIKYKKLKKKTRKLAATKVIKFVRKGQGKRSYKLISAKKVKKAKKAKKVKKAKQAKKGKKAKKGKTNFKSHFKINKKTGAVTVKKGLKKGTYKVTAKVKAAETVNYKASTWKKVTFKIVVK